MKIILAQGNPETTYNNTRHNVGFAIVDTYAKQQESQFTEKTKFSAFVAELSFSEEKVLIVKPTTYYNETGRSARALVDFYKIDPTNDLFVLHDDLALPFGTLRIRAQGSDAGNNGIKSLNAHIGPDYHRLRIGVYNDLRDRIDDADFVLSRFTKAEQEALEIHIIPASIQIIEKFITKQHDITSHSL